jgi:hypothetical protein
MKQRTMIQFVLGLLVFFVITNESVDSGEPAQSGERPQEDQWIFVAAAKDSATRFRSPDLAYCLTLEPDTSGAGLRTGVCTLADSSGMILWKKKWGSPAGRDVIAVSSRGDVAVFNKIGSSAIACGPGVTYETEGPARIHADIFNRSGSLIRAWDSAPYAHDEEVRQYIHCIAFHPSREFLIVGIKALPSFYDEGGHIFGISLAAPAEWKVDLGRNCDPIALDFRGDDIVVTCHVPRASTDSVRVITPCGESVMQ